MGNDNSLGAGHPQAAFEIGNDRFRVFYCWFFNYDLPSINGDLYLVCVHFIKNDH